MKKLLLKLLGFDAVSMQSLRAEVAELRTTIASLKADATAVYEKTEQAFVIIKQLNIDNTNELWWENVKIDHSNPEVWRLAENIKKSARREWVQNNPSLKVRKIFHGGCLGCVTPINEGIGKCLGCKYLSGGGLPDLSKTV